MSKKGEIDRDWFCSGNNHNKELAECRHGGTCNYVIGLDRFSCDSCHRKWPTPEQFKEEYGEDYPDDGAVYVLEDDEC
jgi:hypothetical protein